MMNARLAQDGRDVRCLSNDFRQELRATSEVLEAQGLAAEDDQGMFARRPPGGRRSGRVCVATLDSDPRVHLYSPHLTITARKGSESSFHTVFALFANP